MEGVAWEVRWRQGGAPDLGVVQVDQPVDHEQVRAQRHLVLLLRILEIPVEHLVSGEQCVVSGAWCVVRGAWCVVSGEW